MQVSWHTKTWRWWKSYQEDSQKRTFQAGGTANAGLYLVSHLSKESASGRKWWETRPEVKRSSLDGLVDLFRTLTLTTHRELLKSSEQRTDMVQHWVLEGILLVAEKRLPGGKVNLESKAGDDCSIPCERYFQEMKSATLLLYELTYWCYPAKWNYFICIQNKSSYIDRTLPIHFYLEICSGIFLILKFCKQVVKWMNTKFKQIPIRIIKTNLSERNIQNHTNW